MGVERCVCVVDAVLRRTGALVVGRSEGVSTPTGRSDTPSCGDQVLLPEAHHLLHLPSIATVLPHALLPSLSTTHLSHIYILCVYVGVCVGVCVCLYAHLMISSSPNFYVRLLKQ